MIASLGHKTDSSPSVWRLPVVGAVFRGVLAANVVWDLVGDSGLVLLEQTQRVALGLGGEALHGQVPEGHEVAAHLRVGGEAVRGEQVFGLGELLRVQVVLDLHRGERIHLSGRCGYIAS